MRKLVLATLASAAFLSLTGCSGLHSSGNLVTGHAEAFHIVGFQIPSSAQDRLALMVPKGAKMVTAITQPEDTDSLVGVLNRIFGVGTCTASWEESK